MVGQVVHSDRTRKVRMAGVVVALGLFLTSCTGRGGGWLAPTAMSNDQANLGFSFSCQDSSQSVQQNGNQTGRLHIELQYDEHSTNAVIGPFSIHGVADTIDPLLESAVCIGQNPPPGGLLIFFGTYRPTTSSPGQFPAACQPATTGTTTPQCRFEVDVKDNDGNGVPSQGDYFSITLSGTATTVVGPNLAGPPIYHREGPLGGGNIEIN